MAVVDGTDGPPDHDARGEVEDGRQAGLPAVVDDELRRVTDPVLIGRVGGELPIQHIRGHGLAVVADRGHRIRLSERVHEIGSSPDGQHRRTAAPGIVAGTLAYMAPEQLRGRPADARSDIWALGVVLHEMATGRRPFEGQTGFELSAAIFNQPVPPMPGPVPGQVAGVVGRCLAKEPGERYQHAREVKAALEALSVIGRTSVLRDKKGDTPLDQIGRDLAVDYVLEGSAQREGDRARVTAKLIRVSDQTQVWARPYEHALSSVMVVQDELAKDIAGALALTLPATEKDRLASARTVNPEAYEACVKGSSLWKTMKPADIDAAQRQFEQAVLKDPSYARA